MEAKMLVLMCTAVLVKMVVFCLVMAVGAALDRSAV